MTYNFRRIFKPTKEEEIEDFETLLKLHNDYIGECSTCSNHIPSSYPGFVTDYGECEKNMKHFTEKVCGLRKIDCDEYTEDLDVVNSINKEIERRKNMNELDILDIELLYYLVEDDIRRCKADEEKKLFDLRLLQHKLEVMRRTGL